MAKTQFELISFAEAVGRLELAAHFGEHDFERYGEDGRPVRFYGGDARLSGDIDLDSLFHDERIAGFFAARDLVVDGSVLNWEIDTVASFVAVGRDLSCTNLVAGCADIRIRRDLKASNVVVATYNHGYLEVSRDVHARYVIIDDHHTIVGRKVVGGGWKDYDDAEAPLPVSTWWDEVRPELRGEFFDARGDTRCASGNVDLIKALLAGRPILRS